MGIYAASKKNNYITVRITKQSFVNMINDIYGTNFKIKDVFKNNQFTAKITNVLENEKVNVNSIGRNPLRGMSK